MDRFIFCPQVVVHSWKNPEKCEVWASYSHINGARKVPFEVLTEMRSFGPKGYYWYSTGAIAAWTMLKEHDRVTLTGFDWWDREDHHYSDKAVRGTIHKPDKEREFFSKLEAEGKVLFLS